MQVVYFGESLATKAFVFGNELKCSNGLSLRTNEKRVVLRHKSDNGHLIQDTLNQAIRSSAAYALMKDRYMHTPLDIAKGKELIRQFHKDPDGESHKVRAWSTSMSTTLLVVKSPNAKAITGDCSTLRPSTPATATWTGRMAARV